MLTRFSFKKKQRAFKNAGGIPALVRLFRLPTAEIELREAIAAILWNLSSCDELKKPILDDAAPLLVASVMRRQPASSGSGDYARRLYNTTIFRNASGILRNVSSFGYEARVRLRECDNLIESLLVTLQMAVNDQDIDNKSIENLVCVLRNLSYRCQEVEDPEYDRRIADSSGHQHAGATAGHRRKYTATVAAAIFRQTP